VNRCGQSHLACKFPINVTVPALDSRTAANASDSWYTSNKSFSAWWRTLGHRRGFACGLYSAQW